MSSKKLTIVFIIGGESIEVEANPHEPLHVARDHALKEGEHSGRAADDWEIKDADGKVLDPTHKIEEFNFQQNTKLFMNQKVSGGGE